MLATYTLLINNTNFIFAGFVWINKQNIVKTC